MPLLMFLESNKVVTIVEVHVSGPFLDHKLANVHPDSSVKHRDVKLNYFQEILVC